MNYLRLRTSRLATGLAFIAATAPVVPAVPAPAAAQTPATEYDGAAALGLELRRLGTAKRVLMIAAHPDDENTSALSALVLGQGADAAYLSLTRGEGGQNGIGPELQESLGVLRTEELLSARRLDGARQFFTRAYDFGYSKTADETFRHWPRDSILSDMVAVIRSYRPDVILSVFSGTPRDGHGHHQAAGILALEAFEAAGDPSRFPEQLAHGLAPHSPTSLYRSVRLLPDGPVVRLSTGERDPLLDRSHHQVAMAGRSRHRSQDMGRLEEPGPQSTALELVAGPDPSFAGGEPSLFSGVDTTLSARARTLAHAEAALIATIEDYETRVQTLRDRYNPLAPDRLVPELADAVRVLETARSAAPAGADTAPAHLGFLIEAEAESARRALARAAGIVVDAVAETDRVVPGQSFALEVTLWNGGTTTINAQSLEPLLPPGWSAVPADPLPISPVAPGEILILEFRVRAPADAVPTEPYYLARPRSASYYEWPDWTEQTAGSPAVYVRGQPFETPSVVVRAGVDVAGVRLELDREAIHRLLDRRLGEVRRPVLVVPAASVAIEPDVSVLRVEGTANVTPQQVSARQPAAGSAATRAPLRFGVRVLADQPGGIAGALRLDAPAGWRVDPSEVPLRFNEAGETRGANFVVTAPPDTPPGEYTVRAVFETADGARFDRGYDLIAYPHTRPRPIYRAAEAVVPAFDVRLPPGLRVGYIVGGGDRVPDTLTQLGLTVELLDADALGRVELDRFDAIVAGPRTYDVRPDLIANNRRLLDYVERGGTFIVQFNQYAYSEGGFAPYPLSIARPHDRVTDHESPVALLDPDHRALAWPNRITEADFDGWIQERGLYFAHTWDDRYTPLIELQDPDEPPVRGGLLVVRHGAGTYVYTGLAFFRQLPAGVPGAYRLFANLLSLGTEP